MRYAAPAISLITLLSAMAFAKQVEPKHDERPYPVRIAEWRKQQETDLKSENGWLSVAGLFWLKDGENSVGARTGATVRLPEGSAPENVGTLTLTAGKVTLEAAKGAGIKVNGLATETKELKSDADGKADMVTVGTVTFKIIQRGKRIGVRLYDRNSPAMKGFTGLNWYPADPSYVVRAKFTAYDPPKMLDVTNILGDVQPTKTLGFVTFTLEGKEFRLDGQDAGDILFINFHDKTSGETTYGAGRFLDAPLPKDGFVLLDFNQAYNPPCAFTPFATCPLPRPENFLPIAIKAGEKMYGKAE